MNQFLEYQKKSDETVSQLSEEISKARTDLEMAYLKKVCIFVCCRLKLLIFLFHNMITGRRRT